MSKEPRPLPKPGDPSKPCPSSPPPPKRQPMQFKCCHEHRIEELEAALRTIEIWAANFDPDIESIEKAMGDIERKCREVLR